METTGKTSGETTIYFVSDTTGSLSHTLTETDETGNLIAAYTRGDTLIRQTRGEETSYYLYDGHGDVRALLNEEGKISDKYRYNAYGELLEKDGDTENHYLYTGEYYDGTSDLYYLRARYMSPSTGTFISMDSYEGSIYDPDTLHKYLYANGNPVKYNDPSGNSFGIADMAMATACNSTISGFLRVSLMGLISGITNAAITNFLGGNAKEVQDAFWNGLLIGAGIGAILYVTAAISVVVFARVSMLLASANVIMSLVMTVASVIEKKEKETLVYGTLTILALISFASAYKMNCSIKVTGDKGSEIISWDSGNPDEMQSMSEKKIFTSSDKYVGETATAIEEKYPGKVVDVNKVVYREDGTRLADYDIELDNYIIQVKQGSGKGATSQAIRTATSTAKEVIVYLPDQRENAAIIKGLNREGFKVFTSLESLIEYIGQQ